MSSTSESTSSKAGAGQGQTSNDPNMCVASGYATIKEYRAALITQYVSLEIRKEAGEVEREAVFSTKELILFRLYSDKAKTLEPTFLKAMHRRVNLTDVISKMQHLVKLLEDVQVDLQIIVTDITDRLKIEGNADKPASEEECWKYFEENAEKLVIPDTGPWSWTAISEKWQDIHSMLVKTLITWDKINHGLYKDLEDGRCHPPHIAELRSKISHLYGINRVWCLLPLVEKAPKMQFEEFLIMLQVGKNIMLSIPPWASFMCRTRQDIRKEIRDVRSKCASMLEYSGNIWKERVYVDYASLEQEYFEESDTSDTSSSQA